MVNGIKSLLTKVRGKAKLIAGAITAAVASSMVAITACAEETNTATTDISTIINSAGASLKEQFVLLVQTMVPLLIGIGVVGLGLYAVIYLFKMAKQFFAKAAG